MAMHSTLVDDNTSGSGSINSLWTFPRLNRSVLGAGTLDDGVAFNKSSGGFTMRDSWKLRPKMTDKYISYYWSDWNKSELDTPNKTGYMYYGDTSSPKWFWKALYGIWGNKADDVRNYADIPNSAQWKTFKAALFSWNKLMGSDKTYEIFSLEEHFKARSKWGRRSYAKEPLYADSNVLPNCTAYASARFNEIYAELTNRKPWEDLKYDFNSGSGGNAGRPWINRAEELKLRVSMVPEPGAIAVWGHTYNLDSGHVAIVEEVEDNGNTIVTSGSYATSSSRYDNDPSNSYTPSDCMNPAKDLGQRTFHFKWKWSRGSDGNFVTKAAGNNGYGMTNGSYKFLGFILQPEDAMTGGGTGTITPLPHTLIDLTVPRNKYVDQVSYTRLIKTTNDKNQTEYLQVAVPIYMDATALKPYNNPDGEQFKCFEGIMNVYEQKTNGPTTWLRVSDTPRGEDKFYFWIAFDDTCMKLLEKQEDPGITSLIVQSSAGNPTPEFQGNPDGNIKIYDSLGLLSDKTRVQVPFIKVTIGDHTFGTFKSTSTGTNLNSYSELAKIAKIQYPNYVKSLSVRKINGQVNTYTLQLEYLVTENDDPNFFEKIFSQVGLGGKIIFSYGDMMVPSYLYRNEEAIITDVKTSFATAGNALGYTITAQSASIKLSATTFNFPATTAKPSDVIKSILNNKEYRVGEIFAGMRDKYLVDQYGLIDSDDKEVKLQAKTNITVFDYIEYCVKSMTPISNSGSAIYNLVVVDDVTGVFDGTYFKVKKYTSSIPDDIAQYGIYEIDVGFPLKENVLSFNISSDYTYSLFNKFTEAVPEKLYTRQVTDTGQIVYVENDPILNRAGRVDETSQAMKNWFAAVTAYPINASMSIMGLLRPSLLMQYLKINVYYYGQKHSSSGVYVITGQTDKVDGTGFKTDLELVRIKGDNYFNFSKTQISSLEDTELISLKNTVDEKFKRRKWLMNARPEITERRSMIVLSGKMLDLDFVRAHNADELYDAMKEFLLSYYAVPSTSGRYTEEDLQRIATEFTVGVFNKEQLAMGELSDNVDAYWLYRALEYAYGNPVDASYTVIKDGIQYDYYVPFGNFEDWGIDVNDFN